MRMITSYLKKSYASIDVILQTHEKNEFYLIVFKGYMAPTLKVLKVAHYHLHRIKFSL
jgi:hypothetical protein